MYLTPIQTFLIILAVTLGTMVTRFTPFLLFPKEKEPPKIILQIGRLLPPAMMGLLVVYCLKDVSLTSGSYGIPEGTSILTIILLHKWKQNVLLSILGGTVIYMVLIQAVF